MAVVSQCLTVICLRNAVLLCLTYCLLFTYSTCWHFLSPSTGGQQEGHSLHRGSHEWNQSKETAEARGRHSGTQQQFLSLHHFLFLSSVLCVYVCMCVWVGGVVCAQSNSSYNALSCTSDIRNLTYMTGVESSMYTSLWLWWRYSGVSNPRGGSHETFVHDVLSVIMFLTHMILHYTVQHTQYLLKSFLKEIFWRWLTFLKHVHIHSLKWHFYHWNIDDFES